MKDVIIIVPIYKEKFSETENISLNQLRNVLKDYPICFIAPEKLKSLPTIMGEKVKYFSDDNFANIESYSRLLLDYRFYQLFADYNYMLIYQLDAFVFDDKLKYFCSLGYDYIGSPMPNFQLRKTHTLPNLKNNNIDIGNGGFSLRKISSCINLTKNKEPIYLKFSTYTGVSISTLKNRLAEDRFFAFCGKDSTIDFSIPSFSVANKFAIMYNLSHSYERISEKNLPFGCHGWSKKIYFPIWKPYIKKFFKNLDKVEKEIYKGKINIDDDLEYFCKSSIKLILLQYLLTRIMRNFSKNTELLLEKYISNSEKYVLWGNGTFGRKVCRFLKFVNIDVVCFFDKKAKNEELQEGTLVKKPDLAWATSNGYKIIITISDKQYINEVIDYLLKNDMEENKDFFVFEELAARFLKKYYENIFNNMVQN